MITDDEQLLSTWIQSHSDKDFHALVEQRLPHVLAVATRITRNPELARDVAQQTFIRLATKPPHLKPHQSLSSWLHMTTRSFAIDCVRSEDARRRREQSSAQTIMHDSPSHQWETLSPVIDDLIARLSSSDREAILLRFYENKSHADIGKKLGLSENTARMRVKRAIDKLQRVLIKRGITTTTAVLATTLSLNACPSAPAHLATSISSAALTNANTALLFTTIAMKLKLIALPASCLALLAIPLWQQTTINDLKQKRKSQASSAFGQFSKSSKEFSTKQTKTKPSVTIALKLARISDPLEREAALAQWAETLTSNEMILEVLQKLKNDSNSSARLRAVIAPHLTRQWALVDPLACINTFIKSSALHETNPFDAPEIRANSGSYFSLIATTNPEAFKNWASSTTAKILPTLLNQSDPNSKEVEHRFYPGKDIHSIITTLARFAPNLTLEIVTENPNVHLVQNFLNRGDLLPALLTKHGSPDKLWPVIERLPHSGGRNRLLQELAKEKLTADKRPFEEILTDISQRAPGPRLINELNALSLQLSTQKTPASIDDPAAENQWLTQLNAIAEVINTKAPNQDKSYDQIRSRLATLAIEEDLESAIRWTQSIINPEEKLNTTLRIAATIDSRGTYDASRIHLEKGRIMALSYPNNEDAPILHMVLAEIDLSPSLSIEATIERMQTALQQADIAHQLKEIRDKPSGL